MAAPESSQHCSAEWRCVCVEVFTCGNLEASQGQKFLLLELVRGGAQVGVSWRVSNRVRIGRKPLCFYSLGRTLSRPLGEPLPQAFCPNDWSANYCFKKSLDDNLSISENSTENANSLQINLLKTLRRDVVLKWRKGET